MRTFVNFSMAVFAFVFLIGIQSCNDDDESKTIIQVPPSIELEVNKVGRTTASFSITSDKATDYAYAIRPASEKIPDATTLFKEETTGIFEEDSKVVNINLTDLIGDNDYKIYAAVRTINPFNYSDIVTKNIDTHVPFSEMISLESVGTTSFSYHIMKPKGVTKYKHVCLSKSDFDYIINLVGGTPASYVNAFGTEDSEDKTYVFDTSFQDVTGFSQDIYSDMEFIIIAGELDQEGSVAENTVKTLVFKTKKAGKAPYNIQVNIKDITSMTAAVNIIPEPGIERFRYHINTKAEFDFVSFEGEASIRRMIIGPWSETNNEGTGAIVVNANGLKPNTHYQVGIVGFDKERREKLIFADFKTGEPTGPLPELSAEPEPVETPWNKAAFRIKAAHTTSIIAGVFPQGSIDEVLSRPGNESLTAGDVIANNGSPLSPEQVAAAVSAEGMIIESSVLNSNTKYEFGIYATNEEGVGISVVKNFTTTSIPQFDGNGVRSKLPGKYTATTKDYTGRTISFPVTIATGVNESTEKEYHDKNRLVLLGFSPSGIEYTSPEILLENGWATSQEEANANYGPKWFIEFNKDNTISTSLPVNGILDYNMAKFNGHELYFHGFAKRPNSDKFTDMPISFPVEVTDNLTLTIKKTVDNSFAYYPGVLSGSSQWWGETAFAAAEQIVLTRDANQKTIGATAQSIHQILVPKQVKITLDDKSVAEKRRLTVEKKCINF